MNGEQTYLPKHLLMPFFDGKTIYYKMGNKPEQQGWLGLSVFGDGSVSLHLYFQSMERGVAQSLGQILSSDMLDKLVWNEGRKAFVGHF